MTSPEQIVRALAATPPAHYVCGTASERACVGCGSIGPGEWTLDVMNHAVDCPWRLAVEWVAKADCAHDESRAVHEDASAVTCGTCGASLEVTAEDLARLAAAPPQPPHIGYADDER